VKQRHYCFDVKAIMHNQIKYNRLMQKVMAYTHLIAIVGDVSKVKEYIHKRALFQREADKLRKRLDGVAI
jgi:hypothetical protein